MRSGERQDVCRLGLVGRLETQADVESGGIGRESAEPHDREMRGRVGDEVADQQAADAEAARGLRE